MYITKQVVESRNPQRSRANSEHSTPSLKGNFELAELQIYDYKQFILETEQCKLVNKGRRDNHTHQTQDNVKESRHLKLFIRSLQKQHRNNDNNTLKRFTINERAKGLSTMLVWLSILIAILLNTDPGK